MCSTFCLMPNAVSALQYTWNYSLHKENFI